MSAERTFGLKCGQFVNERAKKKTYARAGRLLLEVVIFFRSGSTSSSWTTSWGVATVGTDA